MGACGGAQYHVGTTGRDQRTAIHASNRSSGKSPTGHVNNQRGLAPGCRQRQGKIRNGPW
jgi:hypothetical protein